jgi:hypothetical protein
MIQKKFNQRKIDRRVELALDMLEADSQAQLLNDNLKTGIFEQCQAPMTRAAHYSLR